jgi:hypothetical protein
MKSSLHRAFSFILNSKNEIMLQQRAHHKYHSPLLWTTLAVAINVLVKLIFKLEAVVYLKKWDLKQS